MEEGSGPPHGVAPTSAHGVASADSVPSEVLRPDDGINELIPFADDEAFRNVGFRMAGTESSDHRERLNRLLLVFSSRGYI